MSDPVTDLLAWLDKHNGAVVAVATAVNVLVAAFYAFVTWRLWRVAADQAAVSRRALETSQAMAVSARAQVDASTTAARAAEEQARVTQQTFEASNRPYLVITSQEPERRNHPNSSRMAVVARFALENRGSVPGILKSWRLEARTGRQVLAQPHHRQAPGLALAVVPGGSHPMPEIEVDIADRDPYYREQRSIIFEAEARYEGLAGRPYATRVVTEFTFDKDAMRYETREIKFE
ncbi:MAG: hypothetical protein HY615_01760 [Candidatus Rokubacteria bacterium]|nr:hypothetical protein [Candidatus Rokubacteria bacterium]